MCLKSPQLQYLALDRKDTVVFPEMKAPVLSDHPGASESKNPLLCLLQPLP